MAADYEDIIVEADGTLRFVYSDTLASMFLEDDLQTTRASHVEPAPCGRGWIADMAPVGGPVLYADRQNAIPFITRQEALDAERAWLREEMGL